jgi:hypothetical protein
MVTLNIIIATTFRKCQALKAERSISILETFAYKVLLQNQKEVSFRKNIISEPE